MGYCDLHTHSIFSDGTSTPEEIVDGAAALGLSAVALCDHNTVDGLSRFLAAAEGRDIDAVAGAEFSVDYKGKELHLLGLRIPPARFGEVSRLMLEVGRRKEESNRDLIGALAGIGFLIDYEALRRTTPSGKLNRAHIAAELTRKGYTPSIRAAFNTVLSKSAGFYREPERLQVWEMLDFLSSIGAVPVLAHPLLNLSEEELFEFLPAAKERGLVGMECLYSTYSSGETALSLELAERFGLKPSGGSDFHGANKPDIQLGRGRGGLAVPGEWARALGTKTKETDCRAGLRTGSQ